MVNVMIETIELYAKHSWMVNVTIEP